MIHKKFEIKNYNHYRIINFIYIWLVSWGIVCLFCLYQPIVELWVGTELLLPFNIAILSIVYFSIRKWMDVNCIYQKTAGLYQKHRYLTLITWYINIIIGIVFVLNIGFQGIVILITGSTFIIHNFRFVPLLFKPHSKKPAKKYILEQLYYLYVIIEAGVITYWLCSFLPNYGFFFFIIKAAICLIFPNLFLLLLYFKQPIFSDVCCYIKGVWKGRRGTSHSG